MVSIYLLITIKWIYRYTYMYRYICWGEWFWLVYKYYLLIFVY
jgi:hypothetical protein